MRKLNFGRWLPAIAVVALCNSAITSCSSDSNDDDIKDSENNRYRVTVTIGHVDPRDYVSVSTVGGLNSNKTDVWKVNGTVRPGETTIGLGKQDFSGTTKTYVIETVDPIRLLAAGVEIMNYDNDMPINYKIEKNSKVVIDENLTLKGDNSSFTKNYSF